MNFKNLLILSGFLATALAAPPPSGPVRFGATYYDQLGCQGNAIGHVTSDDTDGQCFNANGRARSVGIGNFGDCENGYVTFLVYAGQCLNSASKKLTASRGTCLHLERDGGYIQTVYNYCGD